MDNLAATSSVLRQQLRDLNAEFNNTQTPMMQAYHSLTRALKINEEEYHRKRKKILNGNGDDRSQDELAWQHRNDDMTTAPQHPPVHSYGDAADPFEIIDSRWGRIERWRALAMSTGEVGSLQRAIDVIRNDAAEVAARADEVEARKGLVQHLCDQIAEMQERINALADALEARHRADEEREEREAAFEEEPLAEPPGTVEDAVMNKVSAREIIARDETHTPGGELHTVAAKNPGEGDLPEPPLGTETDDMGGVPLSYKSVPTSYVGGRRKDQDLPPGEPLDDPLNEELLDQPPKGKVFPQPVAISLSEK
jgi:hypothetical protein